MNLIEQSSVSRLGVDVSSPRPMRAAHAVETYSLVAAALLAVFYFATSIYIASHRPFWIDEILTVEIAQLPDYRTIWSAVTHGVDGGSPVYDVVVRTFDKLVGNTEVAARLPSVLAMVAGMLIVFDCARRLTDNLHGLIALSILTCSFLPYYGHEARAYAIYFMLAALSLWLWVHAPDGKQSSAVLFGAVIFLAVTMHYYAVLLLAPYALWEISRWKPWRRPSWKLMAGVLGAVVALALLSPAIVSFAPVAAGYARIAGPAPVDGLRAAFPTMFPDGLWLLAGIAVWIALAVTKDNDAILPQPMQPSETVGWLFLCIPLAGFVVTELKASPFMSRYFIGAMPGVAIAFSCCSWRYFRGAQRVTMGILLILATYGVAQQVTATRHPERNAPSRHDAKLEDALRKDGKQYFLVTNQARYLEARHYSKHPEQYAYLASLDSGDLHQTMALARYYPMHFWTLEDLKEHARETALVAPYPRIVETLKQAGFQLEVQSSMPLQVFYLQ